MAHFDATDLAATFEKRHIVSFCNPSTPFTYFSKLMDFLVLRRDQFDLFYNCTDFDVDQVPFSQRQKPLEASIALALFIVLESMYLPCMVALWRNRGHSCYKIMFAIGLADIPCLALTALLDGIFGWMGVVYCSCPTLIYVAGMFAIFFWSVNSLSVVLLALNRCVDMALPSVANSLFHGRRTWLFFLPILVYSAKFGFFTTSVFWSSVDFMWGYDPYFGYNHSLSVPFVYENRMNEVHDAFIALAIPALYLGSFVLLRLKHGVAFDNSSDKNLIKRIFLQSALISAANVAVTAPFALMWLFPSVQLPGPLLTFLATYMWILCHGLPPLIYLCVNKNIRNECKTMLKAVLKMESYATKVGQTPNTVIVLGLAQSGADGLNGGGQ